MKKLMMTTAIVAMTSMGAAAQTANTTTGAATQTGANASAMGQNVPAFVVSNFTGKNLYTLHTETAQNLRGESVSGNESIRWESSPTFAGERDAWEDVGSISDVVISKDGEVRGILIDVGGFLGLGARTVMVDINELYFVADDTNTDGVDDFSVVAAMTQEQMEALPEWDENLLSAGFESRSTVDGASMTTQPGRTTAVGTEVDTDQTRMESGTSAPADGTSATTGGTGTATTGTPEGYTQMGAEDRTAERLIGASAYGREGEDIATVDDLVLDADGAATHVIMDVGGFLGMGTHTIAIEIDQVDILWNDQDGNVMVQVPMTEDQLRDMPAYEG